MCGALLKKLESYVRLSHSDKKALESAFAEAPNWVGARKDLIREGETPQGVNLIMEGWAYRYKQLEDGRRQILAFFLPGDLCDLNIELLRTMDHSIGAITSVKYQSVSSARIEQLTNTSPRVEKALHWETLVNIAIQREWTVNLGQRRGIERIAHLFCELFLRLSAIGQTSASECEMPLTQTDLADATGLSAVHANRVLQELRSTQVISFNGKKLKIHNFSLLREISLFDESYLHLHTEGSKFDAP
ncbi:Crp/Fnr family transcriptional regulator (plasmid) [Kozakia baliensis]|uniref:Crp/Fnr family transcriptional regulator n=1 Tax=Kozakia baliensis TaxID=153496 RepID=UPI00345B7FE2